MYSGYAAARTRGLYNVEAEDGRRFRLEAEIPIEADDWQVGVVVGASGSGKSSIGRALAEVGWAEWRGGRWAKDQPIIEVLGKKDYSKACGALAAVGLGSVPSWLRPHRVLSTGEQFRADMAQLLLRKTEGDVLIDEFTSVLDRRVAQVGAGAFVRSWRRIPGRRIVLITCHHDILEWVQPDWVLETGGAGGDSLDINEATLTEGLPELPDSAYTGDEIGRIKC